MKRDSLFYQLFQQSPTLLFELIDNPPNNAQGYRFDSVAVKEPRFEIDGVFLPPEGRAGTVFFCEVQMQRDERLYERLFAEVFLYFYRNRSQFQDWQVVVIYPGRRTEQQDSYPYRGLLETPQVHRVYLDELGAIRQLPLWAALMVLTILDEQRAPEEARYLLGRVEREASIPASRAIIDMVITIVSYRFEQLSRSEVEIMLGLAIKKTQVYRDIKEEGREEGRREAADLVIGPLEKRFGSLGNDVRSTIQDLSLSSLKSLSIEVLDFSGLDDLQRWLAEKQSKA